MVTQRCNPLWEHLSLVEPDLPLDRYKALGSTLSKMPKFVYSPRRDNIVRPLALDPNKLADAIQEVSENYRAYAVAATRAARQIRECNAMDRYAKAFISLVAG